MRNQAWKVPEVAAQDQEVTRYTHLVLGHGVELRGEGAVVCVVEQRAALLQALGDEGGLQLLVALLVTCNSNTVNISATRKWLLLLYKAAGKNNAT